MQGLQGPAGVAAAGGAAEGVGVVGEGGAGDGEAAVRVAAAAGAASAAAPPMHQHQQWSTGHAGMLPDALPQATPRFPQASAAALCLQPSGCREQGCRGLGCAPWSGAAAASAGGSCPLGHERS